MKPFVTEVLVLQQDWLWFLAVLSLSGALMVAIRQAADRERYIWVAGIIGGYLVTAVAELVRLAQFVRPPEKGPPNLEMDLLLGGFLALQVWSVWRPAGRQGLWFCALGAVGVLGWLRYPYPGAVTLGLCLAGTAGVFWRSWREGDALGRQLAWLLVPGFWLSPVGPLTTQLNSWMVARWSPVLVAGAPREEDLTLWSAGLRRWSTVGVWGSWSALVLLVCGALCAWRLIRRRWSAAEREELSRFLPLTLVWIVGGLLLAAGLGWRSKREFEAAQKQRVNLAAKLLLPHDLDAAFGPVFDPQRLPGGSGLVFATVSREFQKAVLPVRQQLTRIQEELPDDSFAFVLVERNGLKVAGAVASSFTTRTNRKMVLEPEPDFARELQTKFLPPHREAYGLVTQARAPLYFSDGRFLGWMVLEFGSGEWLAGQTQVRVQALAIVGLGFGLAIMGVRQRLRNLARDEALRAAEVACRADNAKSEFLARVSHELRTPIQSVLGYCDLLQQSVPEAEAQAKLKALSQHGHLMARLVEDLINVGALQSGRFQFEPRPTRLAALVRQTTDSLRFRAEAKGLALRVKLTESDRAWRLADGERVRQVVVNLVANAIKFTDEGHVEVSFGPNADGDLVLKVSDTGPGVPAAEASRIFQPFSRLPATAAKEGTGLGLALAKGLCEDMRGGLELEQQAQGACFVARFKLPTCPAQAHREDFGLQPSLRGRNILVVDDNGLIQKLFHSCFTGLGASCETVADGPSALQHLSRGNCDTVVLDLGLPGMDGVEVARAMRLLPVERPRIIGVSAHASAEDRARALAAGMDAFMVKPVNLGVLVNEVLMQKPASGGTLPLTQLMDKMRQQFRAEAPGLAVAMRAAQAAGDHAMLASRAHYLKNSADVLQLEELAAACQRLETAARQGRVQEATTALADCEAHLRPWDGTSFAHPAQLNQKT